MFAKFKALPLKLKALLIWALASTGLFIFSMSAGTAIVTLTGADLNVSGATSGIIAILMMSMFGGVVLTFIIGIASIVIPTVLSTFSSR